MASDATTVPEMAGAALGSGTSKITKTPGPSAAVLAGLTLARASNISGPLSPTVTTTSTAAANGGSLLSTVQTLAVNVAGVADAPILMRSPISVVTSANPIQLGLSVALTDSSETLGGVTISGVPSSSALVVQLVSADPRGLNPAPESPRS